MRQQPPIVVNDGDELCCHRHRTLLEYSSSTSLRVAVASTNTTDDLRNGESRGVVLNRRRQQQPRGIVGQCHYRYRYGWTTILSLLVVASSVVSHGDAWMPSLFTSKTVSMGEATTTTKVKVTPPPGLLFASDRDYNVATATNDNPILLRSSIRMSSVLGVVTTTIDDNKESTSLSFIEQQPIMEEELSMEQQQTQHYSTQNHHHRVHPIHRIYHGHGATIRRRIEEIENSLPYYQTGIRGNPNFIISYKNHPFDILKRKRNKKTQQKKKMREVGAAVEDQQHRRGGQDALDDLVVEQQQQQQQQQQQREELGRNLQEETFNGDMTVETTTNNDNDDEEEVDENPFRPIRIHLATGALDATRTATNGAQIDFVKNQILPRMRDYWTSALSVVPVEGNLRISSADLQSRLYCGDTEFSKVPVEHMSTGIPNTDLVLYVSGVPSTRFCGPSTLAVAVACNFDQFDRPTAGAINFCLSQIDLNDKGTVSESITQDNVDVAVHEAAHILGMSSNSYRFFWDPETGMERTTRPFVSSKIICVDGVERSLILPNENTMKFYIATSGQRYASIVTSKVATIARNQFNCQELEGAQLENQPSGPNSCTGDHWDERMFYPEALSGVISPTTNVLSPLTLALLEDSGWYKGNYTKTSVSPWGHGVGCDFVNSPCLVGGGNGRDGSLPSYAKGYFCNKASSRGCSPSYTHKMACTVIDYSLKGEYEPPVQFQYFSDSAIGGPREADYCPVYGSVYSGLKPEALDCRIKDNGDSIDVIYSEVYGDNSMCFETSSGEGRCYNARCIYDEFNLQVQVDGRWYTCQEDFQQIEVSTLSGAFGTTVTCPRLSSVCPDMFCPVNCAGRGTCNFEYTNDTTTTAAAATGEKKATTNGARPKCHCFDETDTSAGCSDTFVLDGKYLRDGTGLKDTIQTNFFEPLIAVFVDHPDTWTTASWAWAAALFVTFLLMILCICSSFWPEKNVDMEPLKRQRRYAI